MSDRDLHEEITRLAEEEHRLEEASAGKGLSPEDQTRLRATEVQLDQCWDLLRQRRARRQAGMDPNEAALRPASTVEGYSQ